MKPNNRITYRFEHKEYKLPAKGSEMTPSSEKKSAGQASKSNVVPLYGMPASKFVENPDLSNSPFQEDIGALEQLIRESGRSVEPPARDARQPDSKAPTVNDDEEGSRGRGKESGRNKQSERGMESGAIKGSGHDTESGRDTENGRGMDAARSDEPWGKREPLWGLERDWNSDDWSAEREQIWFGSVAGGGPRVSGEESPYMRRSDSPSWWNVFMSVAGALLTGALFGYLILALFTGAELWPSGKGAQEGPAVSENGGQESGPAIGLDDLTSAKDAANGGDNGGGDNGGAAAGGDTPAGNAQPGVSSEALPSVSLTGLAQTYTLLQYGVFNHTEGRDAALAQLREQGLPAAAFRGEADYRVFAGLATDGVKADALIGQMPELLLYKKEVPVAAPEALAFNGTAEEAQGFFANTNELIAVWADLIAAQLEQPSLSPLGSAAARSWQDKHRLWTESAGGMEKGLADKDASEYFQPLLQAMDAAAASMLQYDKEPAKSHLWRAQEALLGALLTQKAWFESMSAL